MTRTQRVLALSSMAVLWVGLTGCPGDTVIADGNPGSGDGGVIGDDPPGGGSGSGPGGSAGTGNGGTAGSGSGTAGGGTAGGSAGGGDDCNNVAVPAICQVCADGSCGTPVCRNGSHVGFECTGGGGTAGSGSDPGDPPDETCPPNTPIPLICSTCPDGTCGEPVCRNGMFSGEFRCAGGGGSSGGCAHAGCSSQLCVEAAQAGDIVSTCEWREEYACYQAAECARQADGACGFTQTKELTDCLANTGGGTGTLAWRANCGDPVCSSNETDDPNVRNCTATEMEGGACDTEGETCETLVCGGSLTCTPLAATNLIAPCPISRARYKQDVRYVDQSERQRLHEAVTHMPLASYAYARTPGADPQLGFIIEDIEPSPAVTGDHVNLYGYLSMAVAAIQVQQQQIETLKAELRALRDAQPSENASVCGP